MLLAGVTCANSEQRQHRLQTFALCMLQPFGSLLSTAALNAELWQQACAGGPGSTPHHNSCLRWEHTLACTAFAALKISCAVHTVVAGCCKACASHAFTTLCLP
jgi:hypothetical protein